MTLKQHHFGHPLATTAPVNWSTTDCAGMERFTCLSGDWWPRPPRTTVINTATDSEISTRSPAAKNRAIRCSRICFWRRTWIVFCRCNPATPPQQQQSSSMPLVFQSGISLRLPSHMSIYQRGVAHVECRDSNTNFLFLRLVTTNYKRLIFSMSCNRSVVNKLHTLTL